MMVHEYTTEDFVEAIVEHAREEGIEQGREQIARNALAEGATIEFIHKITGLSTETIQSL